MGAHSTDAKSFSAALSAIPAVSVLALLSGLITSGRWNISGMWTLKFTTGRFTGFLVWLGQDLNPALRVRPLTVATATTIAALTGAVTISNQFGFLLPEAIISHISLALSLAFGVALFINAWRPKRTTTEDTST